ncbi:5'-methylthioadenosine/adenosylhomocysteine nucleosidase [Treponema sp. HNW]|uniref:5'-methylthioadenosine/adenosylhomocysteine nucleosidase n=1 Tax=Treponema sp. HNW TaxID=3116654 RepID=UPI003D122E51
MKIGVIGAMSVEVECLKEKLVDIHSCEKSGLTFYEGTINNVPAVVVQCGVGKVNAAMCTALLINCFSVTHVINTGVAGGLAEGMHVFDTVVSTDAVHHDADATGFGYKPCEIPGMGTVGFNADPFLIGITKKAWEKCGFSFSLIEGRVASGDVFVNSAERKARIKELCNPACVEMEGAAVAQVCTLNKTPFVIIRSISDLAENTDEVYEEKKAALISSGLVAQMFGLL